MRLLEFNTDGELSLTTFFADKIPQKYAILSHTWEAEEVTFEDLQISFTSRSPFRWSLFQFGWPRRAPSPI
jgi:hypothetical protein